jgi:predicted permease
VLLAFVPRLPSPHASAGLGLTSGSLRITPGTNRRLRAFATTQIALSVVLLAGAAMLLTALVSLQTAETGYDMRHVLAFDIPPSATGVAGPSAVDFYQEATRRIRQLPGVEAVAVGSFVPWRDAGLFGPGVSFAVEGYTRAEGEGDPTARVRLIAPGLFDVLGMRRLSGRDFTDDDGAEAEPVTIVSQSVAQRLFPNGDALNRHMWWTDPYFGSVPVHRRIVGVVADVDDESVRREAAMTIYMPVRQVGFGGRLFVRASGDPYALVPAVTRAIRAIAPEQAVERAATLEDVRAAVLSPERVNAFVFSGFAGIALLIAVVGVAGVLAFSVSARMREFGVRLAIGSTPSNLLTRILGEGAVIAGAGIVAGVIGGLALLQFAGGFFGDIKVPGALPLAGAAAVLIAAAVIASLMPATRASRVDVMEALRSE